MTDGPRASPLGDHMTRKDDKGDQPSGGETTAECVHASSVNLFKNRIDKYLVKAGYT